MSEALAPLSSAALVEKVVLGGDLSALSPAECLQYYNAVCQSVGLNPLTRPFEYLVLDGKKVLYARRECTDQLRYLRHVTVAEVSGQLVDGVYIVTAAVMDTDGRKDQATGAVPLVKEQGEWKQTQAGKKYFQGTGVYVPLQPVEKANAMMKAETKAKRRATLSLCGLGILDESEVGDLDAPPPEPRTVTQPRAKSETVVVQESTPIGERPTWKDIRAVWHLGTKITEDEWKALLAASKAAGWKGKDVATLIGSNLQCKQSELPNGSVYDLVVKYFSLPPVETNQTETAAPEREPGE